MFGAFDGPPKRFPVNFSSLPFSLSRSIFCPHWFFTLTCISSFYRYAMCTSFVFVNGLHCPHVCRYALDWLWTCPPKALFNIFVGFINCVFVWLSANKVKHYQCISDTTTIFSNGIPTGPDQTNEGYAGLNYVGFQFECSHFGRQNVHFFCWTTGMRPNGAQLNGEKTNISSVDLSDFQRIIYSNRAMWKCWTAVVIEPFCDRHSRNAFFFGVEPTFFSEYDVECGGSCVGLSIKRFHCCRWQIETSSDD